MLHITFNMHVVLSASAQSPSDFICSHLTQQKRFCTDVNWQLRVYVLLSESSKEWVVCSAFALNCGHLTLKYCSLHFPVSYSSLNYCIKWLISGFFFCLESSTSRVYVFKCFFAKAMAEFYH